MKIKTILAAIYLIGTVSFSQTTATVSQPVDSTSSAELQAFKNQVQAANPDMKVVSVAAVREATLVALPEPKIAVFVKNQTKVAGMDDMVDGVRDRIAAELAGAGMVVLDQTDIVSGFNRYKVTTDEERAGLIDGIFTGGSTVRVAQMLGADYVLSAAIISADRASLTVSGKQMVSYALRMTVKVCEAGKGSTVYGDNWSGKYPVTADNAAGTDNAFFYNELLDQWVNVAGPKLAQSSASWRKASAVSAELVSFTVSTTIDDLINGLESGVRAPNELLDEMRHVVGGTVVEIDGATVGSAPGTFQVAPGLHQMRVKRAWMKDWQQTVNIQNGSNFKVALELSDAGMQKFQSLEKLRAQIANDYAGAVAAKNVKVNLDTSSWFSFSNPVKNGSKIVVIALIIAIVAIVALLANRKKG